jgi:hypothetical protein
MTKIEKLIEQSPTGREWLAARAKLIEIRDVKLPEAQARVSELRERAAVDGITGPLRGAAAVKFLESGEIDVQAPRRAVEELGDAEGIAGVLQAALGLQEDIVRKAQRKLSAEVREAFAADHAAAVREIDKALAGLEKANAAEEAIRDGIERERLDTFLPGTFGAPGFIQDIRNWRGRMRADGYLAP